LLCLPGLPFFRLPHRYGTRHNGDREQETVNAVCDHGVQRISLICLPISFC
jgi:hypothetical protein